MVLVEMWHVHQQVLRLKMWLLEVVLFTVHLMLGPSILQVRIYVMELILQILRPPLRQVEETEVLHINGNRVELYYQVQIQLVSIQAFQMELESTLGRRRMVRVHHSQRQQDHGQ